MARNNTVGNATSVAPLELRVTRTEAASKIDDRIEKGRGLLSASVASWDALEATRNGYYKWSAYNTELLRRLFSNTTFADEYSRSGPKAVSPR